MTGRATHLFVNFAAVVLVVAIAAQIADAHSTRRAQSQADVQFVAASQTLRAMCRHVAKTVGYAVPCPTRVPAGLTGMGGRPGCTIDIISAGTKCPNTTLSWKGWVVGSSYAGDQHLVLTASPQPRRDVARLVNGPAWIKGNSVRYLGAVAIGGRRMREVLVPAQSNDGSAFAGHLVLTWTAAGHSYAFGFHVIHGLAAARTLNDELARGIILQAP